jgi:hypothetical protein
MSEAQPRRKLATMRALAVAGALVAALVSAAGGRAAHEETPEALLLHAYQPTLVFHPSELFRPTKVQSFVEDAELERFVGTSPADLVQDAAWVVVDPDPDPGELPGAAPGALYRLDQSTCEADAPLAGSACYAAAWREGAGSPALYGRVVRTDTRVVLQYWLFYYANPLLLPPTIVGTFWQSHEGDWEVVNVVLDEDEEPLEAAYSQHCSGERKAWGSVTRYPADSTHPVAYVALGSHANYFAPGTGPLGTISISPSCIPSTVAPILSQLPFLQVADQVVDGAGAGAVVGAPGLGVEAATVHRIDGQAWASFGGRWGESEYFATPIPLGPIPAGAVPVGLAPSSPAHQAGWNAATILAWPES